MYKEMCRRDIVLPCRGRASLPTGPFLLLSSCRQITRNVKQASQIPLFQDTQRHQRKPVCLLWRRFLNVVVLGALESSVMCLCTSLCRCLCGCVCLLLFVGLLIWLFLSVYVSTGAVCLVDWPSVVLSSLSLVWLNVHTLVSLNEFVSPSICAWLTVSSWSVWVSDWLSVCLFVCVCASVCLSV